MDSLDALRWGTAGVIVLITIVILDLNRVAAALILLIVGVIAILYWVK